MANKLRNYKVTLYNKENKNRRDWGLRLILRASGVGIKKLL